MVLSARNNIFWCSLDWCRTHREVKRSPIFGIFILPFSFDMYNNKQVFHNIAVKKFLKKTTLIWISQKKHSFCNSAQLFSRQKGNDVTKAIFHQLGPLGQVGLIVAKSFCCLSPSHAIFLRPLIGPVTIWSVWGLSLVKPLPPARWSFYNLGAGLQHC